MSDDDSSEPLGDPQHPNAPKPEGARRLRRERVEQLLAQRVSRGQIEKIVGEEFGVHYQTVGDDLRWVREKWRNADGRNSAGMRQQFLAGMWEIYRLAIAARKYIPAIMALDRVGAVLGIITPGGKGAPQLTSEADAARQQNLVDLMKSVHEERIKAADVVPPTNGHNGTNGNGKH